MMIRFEEIFPHLNPDDVLGVGEFHLFVAKHGDPEDYKGTVGVLPGRDANGKEPPFEFWMMACEYFLSMVAQKSEAGYEKALELLVKGAMSYKTVSRPENGDA